MRPTPKSGRVKITVYNGFDQHSVCISGRTMGRIRAGKPLHLRGQGFFVEGVKEADSWIFNAKVPGSIHVDTNEGREVFDGNFADDEVWTTQVGDPTPPTMFPSQPEPPYFREDRP